MNLATLLDDLKSAKIQLDSAIEDLQEFIAHKEMKQSYNMDQYQCVIANAADVSSATNFSLEDLDNIEHEILYDRLKG